jgi:hypothetical protein
VIKLAFLKRHSENLKKQERNVEFVEALYSDADISRDAVI